MSTFNFSSSQHYLCYCYFVFVLLFVFVLGCVYNPSTQHFLCSCWSIREIDQQKVKNGLKCYFQSQHNQLSIRQNILVWMRYSTPPAPQSHESRTNQRKGMKQSMRQISEREEVESLQPMLTADALWCADWLLLLLWLNHSTVSPFSVNPFNWSL